MTRSTSKTLTAKVNINTQQAERALNRLSEKINNINKNINTQSSASNKLGSNLERANKPARALTKNSKETAKGYERSNTAVAALTKKVKALAAAYLGVMGAKSLIATSDVITGAENKLNYMNNNAEIYGSQAPQESMDKMYTSAQKVRMGYADMLNNVTKSMVLAPDAFGNNIDNAIEFQEIMAQAYAIGGASAAEMHSSMYQMIQALGSGVLQGDELRSVREGAPLAYKEIEKFAQGVYNTEMSLKDMASQGMITSQIVVAAMRSASDKINEAFADTKFTFAQGWIVFKNSAMKAFEPVMRKMNELLNSKAMQKFLEILTNGILMVARVAQVIVIAFSKVFTWFVDNWYWIQVIVYAVIANIIYCLGIMAVQAVITGLKMFWAFITGLTGLNAWIFVIVLVMTLIMMLAGSVREACGMILGAIFSAVTVVLNLVIGLINAIIQGVYSGFVEPISGIIEWFVNAFNGGFNGILGGAANAIGQIVSMFIGGLKVITKAIDAIGGTNLTAKVTGWQDSAKSWGKKDNAVSYKVAAPTIPRIKYGDAYDLGYKLGTTGYDWMSDKVSGIGEYIDKKLGTYSSLPNVGLETTPLNDLGNIGKNSGKTADNTGKIADAVALTADDLEYLRKIANQEWKKEFTTANITVDMKNYNEVNNGGDLDGVVTKLVNTLYEELESVANGVYV